jgi:hypothetical protein
MTNTMTVEMPVSLRDGHVTLLPSCRTSWINFAGLIFAILNIFLIGSAGFPDLGEITQSKLAGAAGFEPATCGFGDRRSTN